MARGVPDQGRFTAVSASALDALSEAEIEQLRERLAGNRSQDTLSLEGVDGLFCALIASPESVLPSEYLPVILGGGVRKH